VKGAYKTIGSPVPTVEDNANTLGLINGSRVVCLPNSPDTLVGFSAPRLVLLDEASRIGEGRFPKSGDCLRGPIA